VYVCVCVCVCVVFPRKGIIDPTFFHPIIDLERYLKDILFALSAQSFEDEIDMIIYIYIYLFNRNWVDTRWQQYSTHLRTNNTQYRELNIHNNKKLTHTHQ
jgi:hypothetical protein